MKILRIRLTNLNSLRGSTVVDLEQPPLATAGLFAITGPTGAGKTTLLDAVTLALYGRAARYDNTSNPDDVMSRHTGECSAEVEFTCASGTYRSVWQLQRAKKKAAGKLQQAKRRIIALPAETVVAESIRESDTKIVELTGLDYDRFLRSVLLSQGDFAAFLKANAKERTELLQQITGTAIYNDISKFAYSVCSEAQKKFELLQHDHQAIPVLTLEERTKKELELTTLTHRLQELIALLTGLSARVSDAERWLEIEAASTRLMTDKTAYESDRTKAIPSLNRLSAHEKIAPFEVDFAALDRLSVEIADSTSKLQKIESSLPSLSERLATATTDAEKALAAVKLEDAKQVELAALWAEVTDLDKVLAIALAELRGLGEQHAALTKTADGLTSKLASEDDTIGKLTHTQASAKSWIAEHLPDAQLPATVAEIQDTLAQWTSASSNAHHADENLALQKKEVVGLETNHRLHGEKLLPLQEKVAIQSSDLESAQKILARANGGLPTPEIEAQRDRARDQRQAIEKLAGEVARFHMLKKDLSELRQKAADVKADSTKTNEAVTTLQQRHVDLNQTLEAHRSALALAQVVESLTSHRAQLSSGTECPLCGSLHHPFVDESKPVVDELQPRRDTVKKVEEELKLVQAQTSKAEKQQASYLADEKNLVSGCLKLEADIATLNTLCCTEALSLKLPDKFAEGSVIPDALASAKLEETARTSQLAEVRKAEQDLQALREIHQLAQVELTRLQGEVNQQSALLAQAKEQLPRLETVAKGHHETSSDKKTAFVGLVAAFTTSPVGDLASAITLHKTLKERAGEFTRRQSELQLVEANLEAKKLARNETAEQRTKALAAVGESAEKVASAKIDVSRQQDFRRNKFGDRTVADAQREAREMHSKVKHHAEATRDAAEKLRQDHTAADQEKERVSLALNTARTTREQTSIRVNEAALVAGFENEAALRAAKLPDAEAAQLTAHRTMLEETRVALETQSKTLAQRRAPLPAGASEDAAKHTELKAQRSLAEAEQSTLQENVGGCRTILETDDRHREQQKTVATKIDAAQREYNRWNTLRALIGSADGSLFARFAQGLTLERLTGLANRHLAQLSPRYSIRRSKDSEAEELELEIVDHYQAEAVRPMRSLSGGESFLASLALALGMSELASGRTSIESLFIDEGFGSLDAETLETAMSALETLQAKGKTIGVISHVPSMQERITVQVKVTKESNGCSRIDVIG